MPSRLGSFEEVWKVAIAQDYRDLVAFITYKLKITSSNDFVMFEVVHYKAHGYVRPPTIMYNTYTFLSYKF